MGTAPRIVTSTNLGDLVKARAEHGDAIRLFLIAPPDRADYGKHIAAAGIVDGIVESPSEIYRGGGLIIHPSHRTDKYRQGV